MTTICSTHDACPKKVANEPKIVSAPTATRPTPLSLTSLLFRPSSLFARARVRVDLLSTTPVSSLILSSLAILLSSRLPPPYLTTFPFRSPRQPLIRSSASGTAAPPVRGLPLTQATTTRMSNVNTNTSTDDDNNYQQTRTTICLGTWQPHPTLRWTWSIEHEHKNTCKNECGRRVTHHHLPSGQRPAHAFTLKAPGLPVSGVA
jgi:hypothetical protein